MSRNRPPIFPKHLRVLQGLGENLRLARLRRDWSAELVAERAGISRSTLHLLEKGESNTSLGTLIQVLVVLGMADELKRIALDDVLGRKLMDLGLLSPKKRARKQTSAKNSSEG